MITLRRQIRQQRKNLNFKIQHDVAAKIVAQIVQLPVFQQSKKIGLYLATEGEVDITALISLAWQQNKITFLPVALTDPKKLHFIQYEPTTELITSKYNLQEPEIKPHAICEAEELDLVITPLVACNKDNYRCGRGAGFYDRTFAYKINKPEAKPFLLGVAYDFQQIEFEPNPWDVPMQEIIVASTLD